MGHVYIIKSQTTGKTYIGQTADVGKRLAYHNDQGNRLTLHTKRNPGPWMLIYSEEYETRSEAIKREKFLKSGKGRAFLKTIFASGS
ncbi:MAG: GIY-YIG nuclease family protein [Candidatus Edwardsbacteria bacterium]|nr:GIY-YIG nuclease family protein [Candidatus Edwardsbacteria bacterium]MBU1577717.1 GIY-YIG nuclease family protein [Candidatus Edwardsbacteria bacterium]MBU2464243.1 GIY-YIG nuclease family protein [Candidatus Edwardsbacteria bacterium]MBU2593525.1 GIY-YIG nuclease family protein [Candidatus Edwardsbacteria bacterium]